MLLQRLNVTITQNCVFFPRGNSYIRHIYMVIRSFRIKYGWSFSGVSQVVTYGFLGQHPDRFVMCPLPQLTRSRVSQRRPRAAARVGVRPCGRAASLRYGRLGGRTLCRAAARRRPACPPCRAGYAVVRAGGGCLTVARPSTRSAARGSSYGGGSATPGRRR